MSLIKEWVSLNNNFKMPKLGFGTYGIKKKETKHVVLDALNVGYHHLETAPIYLNELEIGEAIKESNISRESLFITSKIPPHIKTYEGVIRVFKRSLKLLNLEYIDALLINNPVPWGDEDKDYSKENIDVYKAMEFLYNKDLVMAIGLSNFSIKDMEALLPFIKIKPQIHQLGIFIGHTLNEIRLYSENKGMIIQAHSPLARGRLFKLNILKNIAKNIKLTPAQIALRYVIEKNAYPIVKTVDKSRMLENINIDKPLTKSDIKILDNVNKDVRDYLPPKAKWIL